MSIRKHSRTFCIALLISVACCAFASSNDYLTIDPNDYNFLVYNCGGSTTNIFNAMSILGINQYTTRDASATNHVTASDLAANHILIISESPGGDTSGLDPDVLNAGITGRVILTGHDPDHHTAIGVEESKRLFSQMISYVLTSSSNTGMIALADQSTAFSWIPSEWGIASAIESGEEITEFTNEGEDSGIYDGLTPDGMSNWNVSYHNTFTEFPGDFAALELGGDSGSEIITIANISPYIIDLDKYDDVSDGECVSPSEAIEYTICWENNDTETFYDVTIVDYLPIGVDYGSVFDPNYNMFDRTYTWDIGTLAPGDFDCRTLDVTVNYNNTPGVGVRNVAHLKSGDSILAVANVVTDVCCWGDGIVYVDKQATGLELGTSWANAYTELQDALDRIDETGCGDEVWVAGGTYSPGDYTTDTFTIPDGVYVYGGLVGNESSSYDPNDREFIPQKTLLTGYIDEDNNNDYVATMGNYTKLHGFTVEDGLLSGVYGSGSNFSVYRSIIKDNDDTGIRCVGGTVKVRWCAVKDNIEDGIYHSGGGLLHIKNSDIFDNGENGIHTSSSVPFVLNSNVHHNGWAELNNYDNGIRIASPSYAPVIQNCTIFRNEGPGIYYSGSNSPYVYNCIFYNNDYHDALLQFPATVTAHYSSVTDANDPNSTDCTPYGDNNMKCDPEFAYIDINEYNLHLTYDSPCIDMGAPQRDIADSNDVKPDYTGQKDIDNDDRVYNGTVDIGSDEVACTDDIANDLDFNGDGLVNYREFADFAKAWLTSSGDPNYIERCDLYEDDEIDLYDIKELANDWLWQACWKKLPVETAQSSSQSMSMPMSMDAMVIEALAPEPSIEERIEQAENAIDFFNEVLEDEEVKETIDLDNLQKVIDSLEAQLEELENSL
ncbi:MAG: right-handed parallel beta-helix repeat-containing protein [Planctomycetes bacterium]|nr:right-handed parallel beta-helix repeat-containing protein [Planctomycetota bacterium]